MEKTKINRRRSAELKDLEAGERWPWDSAGKQPKTGLPYLSSCQKNQTKEGILLYFPGLCPEKPAWKSDTSLVDAAPPETLLLLWVLTVNTSSVDSRQNPLLYSADKISDSGLRPGSPNQTNMTIEEKNAIRMPGAGDVHAVSAQPAGATAMPSPVPAPEEADTHRLPESPPARGAVPAPAGTGIANHPPRPSSTPPAAPAVDGPAVAEADSHSPPVNGHPAPSAAAQSRYEDVDFGPPPQWEKEPSAWRYLPMSADEVFEREFIRLDETYETVDPACLRRYLFHNRDLLDALFRIMPALLARPEVEKGQIRLMIDPEGSGDILFIDVLLNLTGSRAEINAIHRLSEEIVDPVLDGYDDRLCLSMIWD